MLTQSLRWQTWMAKQTRPRSHAIDPPLRAELFSLEQLASHAEVLAAEHELTARSRADGLLEHLDKNEDVLRAFNRSTLEVDKSRRITPAAEWLLDNFYLIEEQIHLARPHLPPGYSRELPRLRRWP